MTTVTQPAFSSPELQGAIDKAREALEGADEARNKVSSDIKALEAYLVGLRLTPPFRYPTGKFLIPDNEQTVRSELEFGGCASGKIGEHAILLDKDTSGKVRLMYEESVWEGHCEVDAPGGPFFWDEKTLVCDIKPLIETKFDVRKDVYGRLPKFVIELAKHYAIDPSVLVDDDEIPF